MAETMAMKYTAILLISCSLCNVGALEVARPASFLHTGTKAPSKGASDGVAKPDPSPAKVKQGVNATSLEKVLVHQGREHSVQAPQKITFQSYYNGVTSGRGIWKWNTALDAYQRHFKVFVGQPCSLAEVGVQSGGSLLMWRNVLGPQVELYGIDINPACTKFQGEHDHITIGDQGDWGMWAAFLGRVKNGLDILVDDGSHEAHHMFTTLTAVFPHTHPGGYVAIEDIHGTHYLQSFFAPTANFLAQWAQSGLVHSVYLYPTLLLIRKGGKLLMDYVPYQGAKTEVADFAGMWTAISTVPAGSHIVLRNPAWPNLFTADALNNFFGAFIELHAGGFKDTPPGCSKTKDAVCTNEISPMPWISTRVSSVHIYKDHAVIEVPATTPRIAAIRKGTEWIGYGF